MKAIKLIIVTIIQFYASVFGIENEEKKPAPEQSYIIYLNSNNTYNLYYHNMPGTQEEGTYLWVNSTAEQPAISIQRPVSSD